MAAQKAVIATDMLPYLEKEARERQIATLKQNAPTVQEIFPERYSGQARDQAAAAVGVSGKYVSDAKRIKATAPAVAEALRAGGPQQRRRGHPLPGRPASVESPAPPCGLSACSITNSAPARVGTILRRNLFLAGHRRQGCETVARRRVRAVSLV